MAAPVSEPNQPGLLVGGTPAAILAASSRLHEVAFRTDNVGAGLVSALAPAATTLVATAPFAPAHAAAVKLALEAVMAGPSAGLGTVATAYEAAALQLRAAAQALEVAGVAGLVGAGGLALLRGDRATVLPSIGGVDLRRESMSAGFTGGPAGQTDAIGVRLVTRPDGSTFYVVELVTSPKVAASIGAQINGSGAYTEVATGIETTLRWAVPTRHDAELIVAAAAAAALPAAGTVLHRLLPLPTEVTIGSVESVGGVGHVAAASLAVRNEVTVLAGGSSRLSATVNGGGQVALIGLGGVGATGSVRVGLERDRHGSVTKLTLTTATEVDRGRHGLAVLEAGNREATLVEKEWELEVTPALRGRADKVATAIAQGHAPAAEDLRALTEAVTGVEPTERTYDVRHQTGSGDVAVEAVGGGGSFGLDTATLRTVNPPPAPPAGPRPAPGPCG